MLLRTGTTTVADIEAMPDLLPEVWNATPLRVFSFLEMTASARAGTQGKFSAKPLKRLIRFRITMFASLSPHAPYSTCRSCFI